MKGRRGRNPEWKKGSQLENVVGKERGGGRGAACVRSNFEEESSSGLRGNKARGRPREGGGGGGASSLCQVAACQS